MKPSKSTPEQSDKVPLGCKYLSLSSKVANSYCLGKFSLEKRIIQRYITKHPKLKASKDLQKILLRLTFTNETIFTKKLDTWYETYKYFLAEKTLNDVTGKESFTHAKLVSAYRSLRTNLPYLFTYKNHKHLAIHNTTNSLDGGVFSPMKMLIKIHRGLSKSLKLKMVDDYLVRDKKK